MERADKRKNRWVIKKRERNSKKESKENTRSQKHSKISEKCLGWTHQ